MKLITEQQLIARLKKMVDTSAAKEVAAQCDVSPQYLCDVLKGRRQPVDRLAKALGCRRVVMYEVKHG